MSKVKTMPVYYLLTSSNWVVNRGAPILTTNTFPSDHFDEAQSKALHLLKGYTHKYDIPESVDQSRKAVMENIINFMRSHGFSVTVFGSLDKTFTLNFTKTSHKIEVSLHSRIVL